MMECSNQQTLSQRRRQYCRRMQSQSSPSRRRLAGQSSPLLLAVALVSSIGLFNAADAFQVLPNSPMAPTWRVVRPSSAINGYGRSSQHAAFASRCHNRLNLLKDPQEEVISKGDTKENAASGTTAAVAQGGEVETQEEEAIYKSAIQRTLAWVGAASLFGAGLLVLFGPESAAEFFAGYLVEESLSVDNLFVFLLLFEYFKVPLEAQDRVLNWGILGAVVMRAAMIGIGAAALQNFHEILLVFAGILVYSSAKALIPGEEEEEEDPSENAIVKFSQNLMSSTQEFDGDRFFTIIDGVKKATPLFICMIAVEISDVVFAVDSIPAVFGVTENPLIVFASNMFAIMGLRSLYTILSKAAADLEYLEPAVAVVLGFIGAKMIAEYFGFIIPTAVALLVVGGLLGVGIGLSVSQKKLDTEEVL